MFSDFTLFITINNSNTLFPELNYISLYGREMCNNFQHMYVMYYDLLEVVQYEIQSTGLKYELPLKSCRCIWYQIPTELPNRIPDTSRR